MTDERIEVEWIATANKMVQVLERMEQRFDKQEKQLQKLAQTSDKTATAAAGSFNKLEQELKENEAALKKLAMGTKEFDEQREKVDALRGAFNKAKGELSGMQSGESMFSGMKTEIVGATGAAFALITALQKVAAAQREIVNAGSDIGLELDTLARKFQIQAGLNDPQRQVATETIIAQSSDAGVKAEQGFSTATALASSDFKDAINNGTLKIALEGMQGTSFTGSPEEYVSAMSQALSAYGLDKTPQNLQAIQVKLAGLFKATDFQAAELTDFAKNASVLEMAGMSPTQALAGFGALREKGTAEAASVQMRNVSLGMMAPNKEGQKAIKELGLKPGQLDMVGESFTDALSTLKAAVEKMPEERRVPLLEQMFGKENIAGAQNLMTGIDRIKELEGMQNNPQALQRDVQTAKDSIQAGRNRIANDELLKVAPQAAKLEALRSELEKRDAKQRDLERQAATELGPLAATSVKATGALLSTIDDATGADTRGGALRGQTISFSLAEGLAKWFMSTDKKQAEQIRLQEEANALARANAQRPQPPAARQPPARNVRPGEAALPGAQAP